MNVTLPRKGDVLTLAPDGLDDDGLATVRLVVQGHGGERRLRVHVRDAVPGDVVQARVESRQRDEVLARVVSVDAPSADRQPELCIHRRPPPGHAPCGGCSLQAMRYEAQLRHKTERVRRQLDGRGLHPEVRPTLPAPSIFHHRHKMELTFGRDRADALAVGLHPSGYRWEILTTSGCLMISPWAAAFLPVVLEVARAHGLDAWDPRAADVPGRVLKNLVVREGKRTSDRLVELVTSDALAPERGRALVKELADRAGAEVTGWAWTVVVAARGQPTRHDIVHTLGKATLDEVLALPERPGGPPSAARGLALSVHPRAFFQPHPRAAEGLVAEVVTRLGDAHARARVADLYCGTGTLGLAVAPFVGHVVGVELVPEAVAAARENAARAGLANTTFIAGDVGRVLVDPAHAEALVGVEVVLLDPPRSGLMPEAFAAVGRIAPARVIYVSCNPTSLARDLSTFAALGYAVDGPVQPVDLFPQTPHVECVVSLCRLESGSPGPHA